MSIQHFGSIIADNAEYTKNKYFINERNSPGEFDQIFKGSLNFAISEIIREN